MWARDSVLGSGPSFGWNGIVVHISEIWCTFGLAPSSLIVRAGFETKDVDQKVPLEMQLPDAIFGAESASRTVGGPRNGGPPKSLTRSRSARQSPKLPRPSNLNHDGTRLVWEAGAVLSENRKTARRNRAVHENGQCA
jgi:hypothetical protein